MNLVVNPGDAMSSGGTLTVEDRPAQKIGEGNEVILVVEDESSVRSLVITVLRRARYRILSATTGDEAIQLAAEHDGPIHLLLTDMSMPGMRGDQLAQRLSDTRPNLKLLIMSGNADALVAASSELAARTPFLPKPFTPAALTGSVRAALDSP
ncbi:MAG TPA: response regulator [Candidatus Solibacter sp.]|nr:response regulator [Candidatus Solibacter sp.]